MNIRYWSDPAFGIVLLCTTDHGSLATLLNGIEVPEAQAITK